MRLYLIRHAQSANNAKPEHERVEDPGLTSLGRRQAERLAEWSARAGITRLVTSPFRRALETTEPVMRTAGLPADVWVVLHEQGGCYRGWEPANVEGRPGMTAQEIQSQFPGVAVEPEIDERGWWRCRPYETHESARRRARELEARTRSLFAASGETVAYVMHGDFKRYFLEALFPDHRERPAIYNAAVTSCEITPSGARLETYNSIEHLDDHQRTY